MKDPLMIPKEVASTMETIRSKRGIPQIIEGGEGRIQQLLRVPVFSLLLFFFMAASPLAPDQDILFIPHAEESRSGPPSLAFTADGTGWVAWPACQNGEIKLAVAVNRKDGWAQVTSPDPGDGPQIDPQWADGPNRPENPDLVYSIFENGMWKIRYVSYRGRSWSKPYDLGRGIHPAAASSREGIWAAWEDDGRIMIRKKSGFSWEPDSVCLSPDPEFEEYFSHPRLAGGPGGDVWLAWSAARKGYQSVRVKRMDKAGYPELTVDDGSGVNRDPAVSVDSEGRAWIVYESLAPAGEDVAGPDETGRPLYLLDRPYRVEFPSRILRVTDGRSWWVPAKPATPAPGLVPGVFCSSRGTVWLV
ncbi:MAG: hypothetical protein JXE07_04465, partial [Candidatus Aminicenantes bacterium]|nr:hypothetical protein [Candidatus Aminicenantes bacterium]